MGANPNGDDAWEKFKKATCLIQTLDPDGSVCNGTGFVYGGGWVMSVAHNFQSNADSPQLHSLLSEASFRFTVGEHSFDFPCRRRMAFIHHLQPGNNVDPNNMDIGMVKLGKQYEYDRRKFQDWEIAEEEQLKEMNLQSVFATIDDRETVANDTVHAIHYDENLVVTPTELTVRNVRENQDIPIIELQPQIAHGASGCSILNTDFKLVGLFFGGDEAVDGNGEPVDEAVDGNGEPVDEAVDGNGEPVDNALMWKNGIERYISKGVSIIAGIGRYMALKNFTCSSEKMNQDFQQKAAIERRELEKKAKDGKLTIYLMNDEVINGS